METMQTMSSIFSLNELDKETRIEKVTESTLITFNSKQKENSFLSEEYNFHILYIKRSHKSSERVK